MVIIPVCATNVYNSDSTPSVAEWVSSPLAGENMTEFRFFPGHCLTYWSLHGTETRINQFVSIPKSINQCNYYYWCCIDEYQRCVPRNRIITVALDTLPSFSTGKAMLPTTTGCGTEFNYNWVLLIKYKRTSLENYKLTWIKKSEGYFVVTFDCDESKRNKFNFLHWISSCYHSLWLSKKFNYF